LKNKKQKVSTKTKTLSKTPRAIINRMIPQSQGHDLDVLSSNQDVLSKTLVQAYSSPSPRQNKAIINIWKKWDVFPLDSWVQGLEVVSEVVSKTRMKCTS
jgi:hypothetical protein